MDPTVEHHINFTKTVLVDKIIKENFDLNRQKLVKIEVTSNDNLNGFMSNIIFLNLFFEDEESNTKEEKIIVKLQKGSIETRRMLKNDIQFANEIKIYNKVIPAFLNKFKSNFKTIDTDLWCPKIYLAEAGVYPQLSEQIETILAVENLTPLGYKLGGREYLTPAEMKLMTKPIAQWHACTYALRIQKDPLLEKLRSEMVPLTFKSADGRCFYNILYEIALDRLFDYIDSAPEEIESEELRVNVELLRAKYGKNPLDLMEQFLVDDTNYSVILHGDYNRNNVLFRYDEDSNPVDLRMIDFQETRYGSPALDLAFYFYMNMDPKFLTTNLLEELYESYHKHLISALCELLDCSQDDQRLDVYSFENCLKHFKKYAFYGAMVAFQFLPWMTCPSDECEKLIHLWFTDMKSQEFRDISMVCGGKPTNQRLMKVLRLASRLGHLDILKS